MIVVDSSVWIDFLNGRNAPHVRRLGAILGIDEVIVGDLMLCEVLQGLESEQAAFPDPSRIRAFVSCECDNPRKQAFGRAVRLSHSYAVIVERGHNHDIAAGRQRLKLRECRGALDSAAAESGAKHQYVTRNYVLPIMWRRGTCISQ